MNTIALSPTIVAMLLGALILAMTFPDPQDGGRSAPTLVPAGSINDALQGRPVTFVTHAEPAVLQFTTAIRDRFAKDAPIVTEAGLQDGDLAGRRLMVYATPDHPWLRAHAASLPFRYEAAGVRIDGRQFAGKRLRVIAAIRNPTDPARRAVIYSAANAADLVNINAVFHGPTEWVVADGDRVLAAGAFTGVPLTAEQWQADLDFLVAKIAAVHPAAREGLPDAVTAAAAAVRQRLRAPCARGAGARALGSVLLALHDAHSSLSLPSSGERLALPILWLAEGPVVSADHGELHRGDAILAIAGRTPAELLASLGTLVPAENVHWLRHRAPELLADLGTLRVLGIAESAPVRVRVARDGEELDVDVGTGAAGARSRSEPWVRFSIEPEHGLGILTLDRCVVDATYRNTLERFFQQVHAQKIPRIAVDLRANSGGNSAVTDAFLTWLDVESFASFSGDVRWSEDALAQRQGKGAPRFEPAQPVRRSNPRTTDPPPFVGEVFVLTGPATFSSGNWFALVLRDNVLAKVVGEPTGNSPSSYGDILTFTLPHSACSFTLSFKRWVRPQPERDPAMTLEPDVSVPRTAQSLRDGTDPVLTWLRQR